MRDRTAALSAPETPRPKSTSVNQTGHKFRAVVARVSNTSLISWLVLGIASICLSRTIGRWRSGGSDKRRLHRSSSPMPSTHFASPALSSRGLFTRLDISDAHSPDYFLAAGGACRLRIGDLPGTTVPKSAGQSGAALLGADETSTCSAMASM